MHRATPLLSKLGKIYKINPDSDLLKNWNQALEDLRDVEIERGFERMTREYKNPFLPPPSVFRKYALQRDQQTTDYALPKKPDPDYWREKARIAALNNKRLDPVGAQKHFQATGVAPDGFILDEDNIVRWDPNWKPKLKAMPKDSSPAEKTLTNIISKTQGYHALHQALSPQSLPQTPDDAERQVA